MKRLLASIILLLYFTVSSGFVVSLHYCMNRLDSAQLGDSGSDKCGKCGMHKGDNNCCRDEVKIVKLESSHFASELHFDGQALTAVRVINTGFLLSPFRNFTTTPEYIDSGPPPDEQHVYIENCVFRI
ncbi:MAG TPA: hypothetical protein VFR58_06985 [Flavisolibacter sp.]|nr:hypothetical protein [Flavisolibacter sp.]